MEGSELLKYQLKLMKNDQQSIGFNLFFQQQFLNKGTVNSKQKLEKTEKIIEQWNKLTDEDKMYWQQKEEGLKLEINSKNNQKSKQYQTQEQKDIEVLQNNIQLMKFDEAKQNYKKRIYESNHQHEVKLTDNSNVQQDENHQKQKNNKKNTQRKNLINQDDNFVAEIKKGRQSNIRQSKRCGKRKM